MKTGIAEVNGTRLYYEIIGKGRPLILISGGGSLDQRMWDDQLKPFAEHYQVIRYDIRGIGKSAIPEQPFSHSQDLYALLKFLNVEKSYILGLSFGGAIAIDLALEHPEMVAALLPVASGLSDLKDVNMEGASALSSIAKEKGVSLAIQLIVDNPSFISPENAAARQKARQIISENAHIFESNFPLIRFWQPPQPSVSKRLAEIRVPTLLIIGDKDYPAIHEITNKLEAHIAGARKVVISGAGHMVNLDKAAEFNRVVLEFLHEQ